MEALPTRPLFWASAKASWILPVRRYQFLRSLDDYYKHSNVLRTLYNVLTVYFRVWHRWRHVYRILRQVCADIVMGAVRFTVLFYVWPVTRAKCSRWTRARRRPPPPRRRCTTTRPISMHCVRVALIVMRWMFKRWRIGDSSVHSVVRFGGVYRRPAGRRARRGEGPLWAAQAVRPRRMGDARRAGGRDGAQRDARVARTRVRSRGRERDYHWKLLELCVRSSFSALLWSNGAQLSSKTVLVGKSEVRNAIGTCALAGRSTWTTRRRRCCERAIRSRTLCWRAHWSVSATRRSTCTRTTTRPTSRSRQTSWRTCATLAASCRSRISRTTRCSGSSPSNARSQSTGATPRRPTWRSTRWDPSRGTHCNLMLTSCSPATRTWGLLCTDQYQSLVNTCTSPPDCRDCTDWQLEFWGISTFVQWSGALLHSTCNGRYE